MWTGRHAGRRRPARELAAGLDRRSRDRVVSLQRGKFPVTSTRGATPNVLNQAIASKPKNARSPGMLGRSPGLFRSWVFHRRGRRDPIAGGPGQGKGNLQEEVPGF